MKNREKFYSFGEAWIVDSGNGEFRFSCDLASLFTEKLKIGTFESNKHVASAFRKAGIVEEDEIFETTEDTRFLAVFESRDRACGFLHNLNTWISVYEQLARCLEAAKPDHPETLKQLSLVLAHFGFGPHAGQLIGALAHFSEKIGALNERKRLCDARKLEVFHGSNELQLQSYRDERRQVLDMLGIVVIRKEDIEIEVTERSKDEGEDELEERRRN